eukprot:4997621-Pleurochrysis_carterae.AAC.2
MPGSSRRGQLLRHVLGCAALLWRARSCVSAHAAAAARLPGSAGVTAVGAAGAAGAACAAVGTGDATASSHPPAPLSCAPCPRVQTLPVGRLPRATQSMLKLCPPPPAPPASPRRWTCAPQRVRTPRRLEVLVKEAPHVGAIVESRSAGPRAPSWRRARDAPEHFAEQLEPPLVLQPAVTRTPAHAWRASPPSPNERSACATALPAAQCASCSRSPSASLPPRCLPLHSPPPSCYSVPAARVRRMTPPAPPPAQAEARPAA